MSANRLLVLGIVRIFQPVHGYLVRRELLTWHAEQWANLNPGSVYNALRTLTGDGFLEEAGTETRGGRPARTTYRLTGDGEAEFAALLRAALWNVDPFAPADLLAAWSFAWTLPREDVVSALDHRAEQIAAQRQVNRAMRDDFLNNPAKPSQIAEHVRLVQARLDGEGTWARDLAKRLRAGEYWFTGEPHPPWEEFERPQQRRAAP
jgi:DNA-binding PadR family transcriptional regulator